MLPPTFRRDFSLSTVESKSKETEMSARRRHGTDEEDLSEGEEGKAELGQFLKILKSFTNLFFLGGS